MKITEVKIYPVKNQEKDKRLKAYVTIVFEDAFIVRDLKIILGSDGNLFVSMPSRRSRYGAFKDIAHPLNSTMRNTIETAVFQEYEKVKNNTDNATYDID